MWTEPHVWVDGRCQRCGTWQAARVQPSGCPQEHPNIRTEDIARGRFGATEEQRQAAIDMIVAEHDDAMRRLARLLG